MYKIIGEYVVVRPLEAKRGDGIILAEGGNTPYLRDAYNNIGKIEGVGGNNGFVEGETVVYLRWCGDDLGDGTLRIPKQDILAKIDTDEKD